MNPTQSQGFKKVGVIGGGQLAWMMAGAAKKLGLQLLIQTPHVTDSAVSIADETFLGSVDDAQVTAELAGRCDVITFENEFVDLQALAALAAEGVCFRPALNSLAPLLDKYQQRCFLQSLDLPVPQFLSWQGNVAEQTLGYPVVMKARRLGYDGQGTVIIRQPQELEQTWLSWGSPTVLLEEFIPFEQELAVIAARFADGEIVIYPTVETQQENQVCRRVIAPATVEDSVTKTVQQIAYKLLESLQAVGVFGIELFLTKDNQVLVNEIAPRTHNSGHFSLDACETSQFEQHLRAVCGLKSASPHLKSAGAVMVNLLGYESSQSPYLEKRQQLAQLPHAHVHWYNKTESRPGRKLGHVTILLDRLDRLEALAIAEKVEKIWYPPCVKSPMI